MARVTVEDCLLNIDNRFALVVVAAQRTRELMRKQPALVASKNKPAVTSLREIAAGKVRPGVPVRDLIEQVIRESTG
ncbi:MAG: DNA-directed RNA polymerase subunit omega [Myxococcota bacterium]|nr:DNA-directed RNA polymerase subunit omega [Myxococcota bacterium]